MYDKLLTLVNPQNYNVVRPSYVFFLFRSYTYAYVTMFYRLVGAVMNLLQANSRFERSWHVSTQKSNTNLDYFTFNQSIKLKFSLFRAIWVCFTWIAHCTPPLPSPLPTTTYSHPSPPKLHPRKRVWRVASNRILVFAQRFWDRHKANIATRWKDVCERLVRRPKQQFWREMITFYPKWIWVMLIQGKCKFLFQQPWNMIS